MFNDPFIPIFISFLVLFAAYNWVEGTYVSGKFDGITGNPTARTYRFQVRNALYTFGYVKGARSKGLDDGAYSNPYNNVFIPGSQPAAAYDAAYNAESDRVSLLRAQTQANIEKNKVLVLK